MKDLISKLDDLGYTVLINKKLTRKNVTIVEIFSNKITKAKAIKNKSIKVYFLKNNSKNFNKNMTKILNFYVKILSKHINPFKIHTIDFFNILCLKSYVKCCGDYNKKNYVEIVSFALFCIFMLIMAIMSAYDRIKFSHIFY